MADAPPLDVLVVTHTHWDREWYHPVGRFRQRLVELVDDLLDGGASPDAPVLLDGQGVVLEDYLAVRPERREQLAALLRDGALEAGPWYVLADELIAGGESLVRNLLAGRRALRELGAEPPPVLYSPDAFGHPAALPMLARGFGLPLIILWRGLGGEAWPPGDLFRWRAPDGTRVLVHHLPPPGYEYGSNLPADEAGARQRWRALRAELAGRARLDLLLVLNGADHHAPQHDLSAALDALARVAAPDRVRRSRLAVFGPELVRRGEAGAPPEIAGELRNSYGYTWTLQGTLGARAHLKRANALVERALTRDAEPWDALATMRGGRPRSALVRAAWKTLLRCHPHDTLCGCSIDAVARAMAVRVDSAAAQADGIRHDALLALVGHDPVAARRARERWRPVLLLRNRAPRVRSGIAEVDVSLFRQDVPVGPGSGRPDTPPPAAPAFSIENGAVPVQELWREPRDERIESPEHYPDNDLVDVVRCVAWVGPVDGLAVAPLRLSLHEDARGAERPDARGALAAAGVEPVRATARALDNGRLRVSVAEDGAVALRQLVQGLAITPLIRFDDVGDAGDLYTHSPVPPVLADARLVGCELVHAGPLRAELRLAWSLTVPGASTRAGRAGAPVELPLGASFVLDAGADVLRVRVWGENRASDHRLRVVLGTGVPDGTVHADAMFGPVERAPVHVSPAAARMEQPPPTAPLHRYVTVAGPERGTTVFSDGLAEYEVLADGAVAVTLLRAVGALSRNDLPERPGHAGWPVATPEAQVHGPFEARFAILPHGARTAATVDAIERAADDVLLPVTGETLRSSHQPLGPAGGAVLEGEGLAFGAVKRSDDDQWTVLRCVNLLETEVHGRWRLALGVHEARASRLDERLEEPLAVWGDAVPFTAPPRGVVTILVR